MAPRKPDVELLFGVLGGGSLSGESGAKIAQDLQSILKDLEKKNILQTRVEITSAIIRSQNIKAISDRLRLQLETAINARPINLTNFNFSNISGGIAQDIADAIKKAMQQSGATTIDYNSLLQQVINNKRSGGFNYGDSNATSELDKAKKTLKQITKLSDDSINAIMHGLQEMSIEIDKVTTKFDDATGEVSVAVRGFNDKGDMVTAVKKYSTAGEKIIGVSKTIVQSFKTSKDAAKEFKHEVDIAFSDLKSIQDEIDKKELKLVNLDPEKDKKLINSIKSELSVLKKDANDIHAIFGNFFSQRQNNILAKQFEDATQKLVNLEAHLKDLEINDQILKDYNKMLSLIRQSQDVQIDILASEDSSKTQKLFRDLEAIQKEYDELEAKTNGKLSDSQVLKLGNAIENVEKKVARLNSAIEKKSSIKQINSDFEKMLYLLKKAEDIQIDFLKTEDSNKREKLLNDLEAIQKEYDELEAKTNGKLSDSQVLKLGNAIESVENKIFKLNNALEKEVNAQGIKKLKDSINDLAGRQKEIGQLRIEIEKLKKAGGKSKQIDELTKQLESAEDKYAEIIDQLFDNLGEKSGDITLVDISKIDKEIDKATKKINAIKASVEDETAAAAQNIANSFKSKDYALDLTKLAADASLLNDEYPELNKNLIIAKTAYEDMQKLINNNDDSVENAEKLIGVYELFAKAIKTASNELGIAKKLESDRLSQSEKAAKAQERASNKEKADLQKVLRLYDQAIKYKKQNTKIEGTGFGNRLDSIITTLEQLKSGAIDIGEVDISNLLKQFTQLKGDVHAAGLSGKSLLSIIKEGYAKYGGWSLITKSMSSAWRQCVKMLHTIIDIDTAMTELKKVTNETGDSYTRFLDEASSRAKTLGATITDTVSASADFARLGYGLDDAAALADAALIYKNVGDGIADIKEASEPVIATMKAFKIEAKDVMTIVDKFNITGNNFAITSAGIGDALLNSAAALDAAGNSLDESIALITASNNVVQDPQKVGTTLKTISMYLRAAKTEAEEAGESTDGMADSISELRKEILALTGGQVDIQIDENTFKNTYQILKELSVVWNKLTDVSQANLLEMLGGKRNSNVVAALLNDFSTAEKVIEKTANSTGSALEENEKYLDSINGRTALFKAAFEDLSQTVVNSDLVKRLIDAGTSGLELLDSIIERLGTITTLLTTLGAGFGASNISSVLSPFIVSKNSIGTAIVTPKIADDIQHLKNYRAQIAGIQNDAEKAGEIFNATMGGASSYAQTLAQSADLATMSTWDMTKALIKQAVAATAAKVASIALNAAWSMLASVVLTALIKKFDEWLHRFEIAAKHANEDAVSYNSTNDDISSYISKIDELKTALDSSTISQEEAYNARKQLLQIQSQIIKVYGDEIGQLDLLRMSAEESADALSRIPASMAGRFLTENESVINDSIAAMEEKRGYMLGNFIVTEDERKIANRVKDVLKKYDGIFYEEFTEVNSGELAKKFYINIDDTDSITARDTIYSLAKDFRDLQTIMSKQGYDINSILPEGETFSKWFEEGIANVNKVLDKYSDVYNQAVVWKIADNSSYTETMESIVSLQEKYNDTLATTYDSETDRSIAIEGIVTEYSNILNLINSEDFFGENDLGVRRYFEEQLDELKKAKEKFEAELRLENEFQQYLDEVENTKRNSEGDIIDGELVGDIEAVNAAREKFIATARQAGMTEEEIALAFKDSKLALDNLSGSIKSAETDILTLNEALSSLSIMQGEVDKLSEALGEFYENKEISADTAAGLIETFGNLQGFDDFISVLTNKSSTLKDVQTALDTLGAEYVESTGILEKLTDENKELIKTYLKKIGVTNAEEIVERKLAKSKYDAITAANGLTDATWDEIEAFLINASASDAVMAHMDNLRKSEYDLQVQSVKFAEANNAVFESLLKAAAAADVNAVATGNLLKAQKLLRDYEEGLVDRDVFDREMASLQEGALTGVGDYKLEFVIDFDVDMPKDIKDKAEDAFEKLQKEFGKIIANFEHNIFLGEKNGADYTAIIAIYKEMQEAVHAQAEKYRAMGLAENSEYIQELQKQWWDYHDKIQQLHKEAFDNYLDDSKFSIEKMANDNADAQDIISAWQEVLSGINNEIEYYQSLVKDSPADFGIKSETLSKLESVKESLLEINKIYGGNVDLTNRKRVDVTDDNIGTVHGWGGMDDTVVGDYMTVASQTFRTGKTAVVVTPILPNGELLNQQELESYMDSLFDNTIDGNFASNDSLGIVMGVFGDRGTWEENLTLADEFAIKVHELHEQYEVLSADVAKFDSSVENATFNDEIADRIQELVKETWAAKEEIENAIQAVVDKANESLDGFQDAYSAITDAAKEYASTGYLSADSLQSLLDLGPKYLSFLEDENGQLVLNEEALQNVIAAKTEEMAVETAMAFAKRVLIAAENDDIKALEELTQVNISATNSTWDMAYATLGLAKAIGTAKGHSSTYYDDAIREVRNIQALAKTTVSSIQEYYKTLNEGYVSQADGLQTILEMTQEMIQWEQEQKVQALEDEKDAISDIVEKQKESLKITKEQNDHEASLAEKLKKIARLRDEIDILSLDNSREAQAEKIAKQEEYDELIKEYADEQAEYSITIQTETLEKTEDALLESKDKEIQAAENTLNSTEKLYQEAIKRIETDWDTLYEDLLKWNYEYGSTLEKDLVNAWDSAAEAVQRYGSFVAALEGVQSHTNLGSSYIGNVGVTTGSEMTDEMSAIYNRMKQNSFDWFLSGDKSKQADLSSENKSLAKEWEALTGQALTSKDFSWYTSDGSLFYSLDKNDVAEAVVSIMESNAAEWKVADKQGNSTKKDSLAATNRQLAADLAYYLGRNIENIGGTWYIDGQPLFDVYHTGGIVGGKGTLKQNEVMAVLEEGEIVLDEGKEKVLYRFVDFAQMMSEKLGRAFDNVSFKNTFSGQNRMPALVGNAIPETTNNMNFNPIVNVNIQHSGSLDDGDAKRFGSIAANSVLSELTDAFSRRGISNMGSAFLK